MAALLLSATAPLASGAATTAPTGTVRASDGRYREFGDGGGFLDILPPGQAGGLTTETAARVAKAISGDGSYPPHYLDQQQMYAALLHASPGLNGADLGDYFKDASFGVAPEDVGRVYQPHDDVTVIRDKSFGVAHIFGRTRYATIYAEGFTTAEDRLFEMDLLRHAGRGRVSELVGTAIGEARDRAQVAQSPYTEADLRAQVKTLRRSGPDGAVIVEDFEAYADGVNAFIARARHKPGLMPVEYGVFHQVPARWVVEDTVAIAALVGGIFGRGGGRELTNACRVDKLTRQLNSRSAALAVFDDLHFSDDAASPTTSSDPAAYMTRPTAVAAADRAPAVDCSSLTPVSDAVRSPAEVRGDGLGGGGLGGGLSLLSNRISATASTPASVERVTRALDDLGGTRAASNALLVSGKHTDTGRPIAVFGPQVGYSAPELVTEKDVHGPGIDARGVAFLGVDAYVQLGRGDTYAWSATSSGADNVDQVVLRLCDPHGGAPSIDSTGYEHDGACVALESWDHELRPPASSFSLTPLRSWHVERAPDYGPVTYRGTLDDGTPIAIATQRSTYGAELRSSVGFKELNDPRFMSGGYDAFREAVGRNVDFSFNWFYVDANDIGYQHSCLCPVRDARVDPYFPTWGTGEYDWQDYLGLDDQPHARNPDSGYLVSWNNRPAPGFTANDGEFSYGPVHRSLLLSSRLESLIAASRSTGGAPVTRASVVGAMIDAATVDLRGSAVLPTLLDVMGPAPDGAAGRVARMHDLLRSWLGAGAHRLDRDGNGEYDDAVAPAIMDAWWPRVVAAIFSDAGHPFETLDIGIDNHPAGHGGSAFASGAYGQVVRYLADLPPAPASGSRGSTGSSSTRPSSSVSSSATTSVAGQAGTTTRFSRSYCGGGERAACADALWNSLAAASHDLEARFGTPEIAKWQRAVADDEIRYQSILEKVPPMEWQNRPTFQQVVQLETERSAGDSGGRPTTGTREESDSGGAGRLPFAIALGAVALGATLIIRRRRRAARRL